MSFEVLAESVGAVTGVQSWRQRVPDIKRCDREATRACACEWNGKQIDVGGP